MRRLRSRDLVLLTCLVTIGCDRVTKQAWHGTRLVGVALLAAEAHPTCSTALPAAT